MKAKDGSSDADADADAGADADADLLSGTLTSLTLKVLNF